MRIEKTTTKQPDFSDDELMSLKSVLGFILHHGDVSTVANERERKDLLTMLEKLCDWEKTSLGVKDSATRQRGQ